MKEEEGNGPGPEQKELRSTPPGLGRFTKQLMLALKAGNLGLITFYSFAIIYVLVRVIEPAFYPWIVFITSVGNYILASDLGFGGYVYAALRKEYLGHGLKDQSAFVANALNAYFQIAFISAAAAAVVIFATLEVSFSMRAAIAIYFSSIVMALPWSLIRRITQAVDRFVAMEVIEFVRRAMTLILAGLMLVGLSFLVFSILMVALWIVAFALGLWLIRREGMTVAIVSPRRVIGFINANRHHVYSTSKLSGLEFVIYNHAYIVLPFATGDASSIVAYDIFYKFMRFGGVSYNVAVETYLPYQTRAFHAGNSAAVDRYRWITIGLELIPFLSGAIFLVFFGQQFIGTLLSAAHPIDPMLRYLVIVILFAIMFQLTAGAVVIGVGQYDRLGRVAMVTVGLMSLGSLATWQLHLNYIGFLSLFVSAYAVHTIMFQVVYRNCLRESQLST